MKLYLSSFGLRNPQALYELIGKFDRISAALITNAFDMKPAEDRQRIYDLVVNALGKLNLDLTEIDLRTYQNNPNQIKNDLSRFDFIWVCGGNVFHLRQVMQESGFDSAIKDLINTNIVYGGDSAGAAVIGPSLVGFEKADRIDQVSEVIYEGVGLIDFVVLPHWGSEKYQSALDSIKQSCSERNLEAVAINDNEAIIVNGKSREVIDNDVIRLDL